MTLLGVILYLQQLRYATAVTMHRENCSLFVPFARFRTPMRV